MAPYCQIKTKVKRSVFPRTTSSLTLFVVAASIALGPRALGQMTKPETQIESIRVETRPNETQVVIQLGTVVRLTYERLSAPDRLFMDLWHAQPGPQLKYGRMRIDNPFVSG